jgi:hypothetical protein
MQEFQVNKNNFTTTRLINAPAAELGAGEALMSIDSFSFTANNITYAVVGEQFGYWQFFPASDNPADEWGIIPVWGFATVSQSNCAELSVGKRLFGYWPTASTLKIMPSEVSATGLTDASPHRAKLPAVYNRYQLVTDSVSDESPKETAKIARADCERMLFAPLYVTAFSLHDMLQENAYFDAAQIVITSASSKTSIGLAFAFSEHKQSDGDSAPTILGLTSTRNIDTVKKVGLYDSVISYDELKKIDSKQATVVVDMSANGDMLSRLHGHLKENMKSCFNVGFTDWQNTEPGADFIQARSQIFFAPDQIAKRIKEWGPDGFNQRSSDFVTRGGAQSRDWLEIRLLDGLDGLKTIYGDVCNGRANPKQGLIIAV